MFFIVVKEMYKAHGCMSSKSWLSCANNRKSHEIITIDRKFFEKDQVQAFIVPIKIRWHLP